MSGLNQRFTKPSASRPVGSNPTLSAVKNEPFGLILLREKQSIYMLCVWDSKSGAMFRQ